MTCLFLFTKENETDATAGSSCTAITDPAPLVASVSSSNSDIVPTINLADEETPIANLAPQVRVNETRGRKRAAAMKDAKRDNEKAVGKSTNSVTSGDKLLKNIKQEK